MKTRRVILTLEVETDEPLKSLRCAKEYEIYINWSNVGPLNVIQAQANVQQKKKSAKGTP